MNNRVLVGMSGGVDSTVAACLLQEQGYDVTGATMLLVDDALLPEDQRTCCGALTGGEDAARAARTLGIPHCILDFREDFRREVTDAFVQAYLRGTTPNPCILCNRRLKFGRMLQAAREQDIWHVATGHYARRSRAGERWLLRRGLDPDRDQSYFLCRITRDQLEHILLPLGELTKPQVRELAARHHLNNADKKDSQDICFVPDGDYGAFLERYTGVQDAPGNYVAQDGTVLGRHRGHTHYTVGQRRGLELAMGHRVYVTGKDPLRNEVYIGENEDLFAPALEAVDLNFLALDGLPGPVRCTVKIRHSRREAPATAEQTGEDTLLVRFDQPQRAITPGQAVALYDGDVVLAGGTIRRAIGQIGRTGTPS